MHIRETPEHGGTEAVATMTTLPGGVEAWAVVSSLPEGPDIEIACEDQADALWVAGIINGPGGPERILEALRDRESPVHCCGPRAMSGTARGGAYRLPGQPPASAA